MVVLIPSLEEALSIQSLSDHLLLEPRNHALGQVSVRPVLGAIVSSIECLSPSGSHCVPELSLQILGGEGKVDLIIEILPIHMAVLLASEFVN